MGIKRELIEWFRGVLRSVPGKTGCKLRNGLYGPQSKDGCRVLSRVAIYYPERIYLGRNLGISGYTQVNAVSEVTVGNDTFMIHGGSSFNTIFC